MAKLLLIKIVVPFLWRQSYWRSSPNSRWRVPCL